MDTIFLNSGNSKTSDPHRLFVNIWNKTNLKRSDKYVALSNLSLYYTQKNIKKSYRNNKLKVSAPRGMKSLNYTWDHNLYQIFKIILNIY